MKAAAGVALGVVVAASTLLPGCSRAPAPLDTVVIQPAWPGCTEDDPSMHGREATAYARMPADFAPVRITVCSDETRRQSDGREDQVVVERTGRELGPVLAVLELADERLTTGACTADLKGAPWFMLADAGGRWLRPHIPVDACGQPRQELFEAVESVSLTETRVRTLRTVQSAAAARAGCLQEMTDMVGYATRLESVTPATVGQDALPQAPIRLCRYDVAPDQRGEEKPQGTFASGGPASSSTLTAVTQALRRLKPATGRCAQVATRFALIWPQRDDGPTLSVELDGCRRVVWEVEGYRLAQGSAELITLLGR